MPIMDGLEATRRIRKLAHWEKTPIIAMTAHAFKEDIQQCSKAGMNDHVSKPVVPIKLYNMLLKWLYNYGNDFYDSNIVREELEKEERDEFSSIKAKQSPSDDNSAFDAEMILRAIPGLNFEMGLGSLNNRVAPYIKLLNQYYKDHIEDGNRLMALIQRDERKAISELAHALKGVSGTLGVVEVQELSKKIELGAKGDMSQKELFNLCQSLIGSLEGFKEGFAAYLDEQNRYDSEKKSLNTEDFQGSQDLKASKEIVSILTAIEKCLQINDTEANDIVEGQPSSY